MGHFARRLCIELDPVWPHRRSCALMLPPGRRRDSSVGRAHPASGIVFCRGHSVCSVAPRRTCAPCENLFCRTLSSPNSTALADEAGTPGSSELRYLTLLIEPRGKQILLGHSVCTSNASLVSALDLLKFLVQPRSARWPRIREEPTVFQIGFHPPLISWFHKGCSTTEHDVSLCYLMKRSRRPEKWSRRCV